MATFLTKTAEHLVQSYGDKLSDCCIVLPNKRAGLFLKKELSQYITKPIWLPEIMGAEDLIEKLSNTQLIDNLTQLFELYNVYQQNTELPDTFEEFSKWGQILLHDFNEIDRYLVPSAAFFATINNVRAIETWNLGEKELSDVQQNYLAFWNQMGTLYHAFNSHLQQNELSYQGKAFRTVAEHLNLHPESFIAANIHWHKIIFVGFNALTAAEETIITQLKKHGKAEVLWDADEYFLNDEMQESGLFLRGFQKKEIFTPFNWVSNKIGSTPKKISIIGVPQNVGQAKYLSAVIQTINSGDGYQDTAVVLSDENLLVPVLESIPEQVENINVTMGYPLKNAPLHTFFELYLSLLLNANRFGKEKSLIYHHKDLSKFLQLSVSEKLFGESCIHSVMNYVVSNNLTFIHKEHLAEINSKLPFCLPQVYDVELVLNQMVDFIRIGKEKYNANSLLEMEYLFHFAKLFNRLQQLNTSYTVLNSIKTFVQIYRQLLSGMSIELYGEPLQGLQVMGMLETRNVDFKNVIILSVNEGVLPSGKTFNSFIPYDVKKEFELPTHTEKDAVYAYHFYRLIQNAENITLIYNTETNEFGSGERSRFVTQIENELQQFSSIEISHKIITYQTSTDQPIENQIQKTQKVIEAVYSYFERGISPSAINNYLACPLNFYNNNILRLQELDEVEETVESNTFGSVIHTVLEKLYTNFANNKLLVQPHDINNMKSKIGLLTQEAFLKEKFSANSLKTGKNLISYQMAIAYVEKFIESEKQWLENNNTVLHIKLLEKALQHQLIINNKTVILKGKADRVDVFGNQLRIVDYKTGNVDPKELTINTLEDIVNKPKALQVLFYAYLYAKEHPDEVSNLTSGIISLRKHSMGFIPLKINESEIITPEVIDEFENIIRGIITQILDTSTPFVHNIDAKYCLYC